MRKSRDLKKVGKGPRLSLFKHSHGEPRAEFGDPEGTYVAVYLARCDPERFCRMKELVDGLVVHLDIHNARIAVFFKVLVLRRYIVSELIKLQDRIVQI